MEENNLASQQPETELEYERPSSAGSRSGSRTTEPRPKSKKGSFFFYGSLILAGVLIIFSFTVGHTETISSRYASQLPIINQMAKVAEKIIKEDLIGLNDDRVNILLLGMGGVNHEGPFLTDTIMLASLEPSTGQAALLSIPRDLSVPLPENGWGRINHLNSMGEEANPGQGGDYARQVISGILDIKIPYYVRIDFSGFQKLIDEFGGLDIYVEELIDDEQYPIPGKEDAEDIEERFEHLIIEEGKQHMDGELALKYVRSRHSKGGQGSDFSRSRRQQKVLFAFKEKVISWRTLLSARKINSLIKAYRYHLATNLETDEILEVAKLAKKIDFDEVKTFVLDDGPQGLLKAAITYEGAFVLLPKTGNFSEIKTLIKNIFAQNPWADINNQKVSIAVQNGTKKEGLATSAAQSLKALGFNIVHIGNAPKQDYKKSVVYDLSNGGVGSSTLKKLKTEFNAQVSTSLSGVLILDDPGLADTAHLTPPEVPEPTPDVLIIVGEDY